MVRSLVVALGMVLSGAAGAAEISVFTTGAFKPVLDAFLPGFEQRTGNKITVTNDTAGGIAARIARGEAFDVAVLTPATVVAAEREGKVILVTPIASVGIGVATRRGAPKPDVATAAAFKAAMLAAPSVAIVDPASGGSSGVYLSKLFDKLGIAAQMTPKLVLSEGGLPAEAVASGRAVLAVGQISELMAVPGVALAGPLPAELQTKTVYVASMNPKSAEQPLILLAALAGPDIQPILKEKGLQPP